jgi:hypothetical protein
MTGLGPVTHDFPLIKPRNSWVAGPRPAMTRGDIVLVTIILIVLAYPTRLFLDAANDVPNLKPTSAWLAEKIDCA